MAELKKENIIACDVHNYSNSRSIEEIVTPAS
jgi:hypothetical protein